MASFSAVRADVLDREERRQHYGAHIMGLNAYDRHKKFMDDYVCFYGKTTTLGELRLPTKTDQDTLRETYRFIRTEEDDLDTSWEQRLAKRYYDKLFKEYCVADMTRYKDGQIGLRWRVEKEVISGKGQFVCGNKKCEEKEDLSSYEVNFSYQEAGERKQALVKLRVCPRCASKLNYKRERQRERLYRAQERKNRKRRRSKESVLNSTSPGKGNQSDRADKGDSEEDQEFGRNSDMIEQSDHNKDAGPIGPQLQEVQANESIDEFSKYFKEMFP